jgi:hypothetical protein
MVGENYIMRGFKLVFVAKYNMVTKSRMIGGQGMLHA